MGQKNVALTFHQLEEIVNPFHILTTIEAPTVKVYPEFEAPTVLFSSHLIGTTLVLVWRAVF